MLRTPSVKNRKNLGKFGVPTPYGTPTLYASRMKKEYKGNRMFGRRYPWNEWFERGTFILHKGIDFNGRTYTMAQQIRNMVTAKLRGRSVSISIAEDGESLTAKIWPPLTRDID